ncbi:MAG: class I SAM-dependent methyltransferase [Promethearchaeota archaeon]|jgi:SAM-dependent methyltransferase
MEYPDHKTYRTLYARYFNEERLAALLRRLPFRGGITLDLCCGEGRVSLEALRRGASQVSAIDQCTAMVPISLHEKVDVWIGTVEEALRRFRNSLGSYRNSFRVIVCQQGVNYWLSRETAIQVHALLEPNGVFAFNTFLNCPPRTPMIRAYELDGKQYWECSYLVGDDMVHHIQACEGIAPHVTAFKWLSTHAIFEILKGLFTLNTIESDTSIIYHCRKR